MDLKGKIDLEKPTLIYKYPDDKNLYQMQYEGVFCQNLDLYSEMTFYSTLEASFSVQNYDIIANELENLISKFPNVGF